MAKKVPKHLESHADIRVDNYYWLRDDDRNDPEVLAHLAAENRYKNELLAHTEQFQNKLFDELIHRVRRHDHSAPYHLRGYWYYERFDKDSEYAVYARKKHSLDAAEEILINANELATDKDYFALGNYKISPDNTLLGYSTDTLGRRLYTIQFQHLEASNTLPDRLENTDGNLVWANDNKTVFYVKKDEQTLLEYQIYRHVLGTAQKDDVLVYEETDKSFFTYIGKTRDDSLIYIFHRHTSVSGVSVLDANNPQASFKLLHPLEENHEYSFERIGDEIYILSNFDAPNFRLMKTTLSQAHDKQLWQEVVPHREQVILTHFELFERYLVLREIDRGVIKIRVMDRESGDDYCLEFIDPVYSASIGINPEIGSQKVRINYSSLSTPDSVYEFDLDSGTAELLKQDEVGGEFDSTLYQSERLFIRARDNTDIPVSLVYRKELFRKDGSNPLYQYGYGSYGLNEEPAFSAARLSLLDRGFVYAIAHIRGSQIMGRHWYEEGRLFNKKNTFTDFIDVTEGLIAQGYAAPNKVFAVGGSAGGLLMGAVINMAPKLYRGVAAHVPFVDVVTTMLDTSLPLTTNEYDEWGNPNEKSYYDYMKSYSPYDNVQAQEYPHLLVTTGLHDSQVQYFEPAKWVAKLREMKTNDNRLVLSVNMDAGHGGPSGRFQRYQDLALEYAFFFDLLGITK